MFTTRRHILALAGSPLLARIAAERFDVDRILSINTGKPANTYSRKYVAGASFLLFSIPLGSKSGVGSAFTVIEETKDAVSIRFGAGSYPESARGLNRLGFIQEAVLESGTGQPAECAYLAFMTTSQEKNLDQAKRALESSGEVVPYTAAQGCGKRGRFASRVERLQFPSRYTWRDVEALVEKARDAMASSGPLPDGQAPAPEASTFLYSVRRALLDPDRRSVSCLFFNGKQFRLETQKEADPAAGAHFTSRRLVARPEDVLRLDATLTNQHTGEKTPFRIWYDAGAGHEPPLRFDYHAKSFLRLTFEADGPAVAKEKA